MIWTLLLQLVILSRERNLDLVRRKSKGGEESCDECSTPLRSTRYDKQKSFYLNERSINSYLPLLQRKPLDRPLHIA
jgi:hypothetical protein